MSFLTAELSTIHQPQSQLNPLQNSSQQNVTTIANHSINDHNFTAIENGTSFDYQTNLANGKALDLLGDDFIQRHNISVVNNNNLVSTSLSNKSLQTSIPNTMNSHGGAAVVVESIPGTGNSSGLPPTIAPAALNGGTITAQNMSTTPQGLGPNMVLVNAATGAPISAPTANSLSGTMTTQSTNSASLPAGISVQQLLQQAQQQQAAQAQQVQQQITLPNAGGNLVSVALASPNTQALQGASGGPQTFTLSALPPSSVMSASGNPPGSTLVSVIPSQGGMIQQQQGASQASAQQILEAGSGTGQFQFTTLNQLPIDLHSGGATGTVTTPGNAEESGVLLCNLDELSRYIPENFYSDFTISDQNNPTAAATTQATTSISSNRLPDYLETVVAAAGKTNQQQSQATQNLINAQNQPLSQSTVLQAMKQEQLPASILQQPLPQMSTNNTTTLQLPSSIYQRASTHSGSTIITAPTTLMTSTQALPNVTASPQYISSVPIAGTQPSPATQQKLTIQLPTQPQPIAGVKTVTYVSSIGGNTPTQYQTITTSANLTPVKLTTTGFAYTSTGERIAIQGLQPETLSSIGAAGTQGLQLQLKSPTQASQHPIHASTPQTLQLQGLTVDPSKLTVLQELPEVGKVVVQETKPNTDSITTILEEMKGPAGFTQGEDGFNQFTTVSAAGGIEYATAIPVAVSSLASDPKKMTIKKVAAPASTVLLPSGNRGARNIIFAGNTLPQGAIPIQINGLNALPLSAVKSLPAKINLSALSPNSSVQITSPTMTAGAPQFQSQVVAAKKTKVEVITRPTMITSPTSQLTAGGQIQLPANVITKIVTNNNATIAAQQNQQKFFSPNTIAATPVSTITSPSGTTVINNELAQQRSPTGNTSGLAQPSSKNVGNNKTCNWVFENGEICGKTFSKSYNLVVHMRMHEDVRPFCCGLCDQTFRQKAHLQRHETTHGIGVKIGKGGGGGGTPSARRKRKRSRSTGGGATALATGQLGSATSSPASSPAQSANLQKRLAHVNEKFGNNVSPAAATTTGTIITTSSFASSSGVLNEVVGVGNNNTTTVITTEEEDEEDEEDHILKVEPGNVVKNYSKKQKQTTATVLQPNNNATITTNATNMVGQILMTPTNVTQIDLGEKVMVTRATKLRQSLEANSNSDDQSVMDLEEVEDEVIKDDDKFKIIEPITTTNS